MMTWNMYYFWKAHFKLKFPLMNHIPRGLVPLENIFDQNDVARDPKMKPVDDVIEEKNIGTKENPRIIKHIR